MQSLSGNAADQTTLYEAAKKVEAIRKQAFRTTEGNPSVKP